MKPSERDKEHGKVGPTPSEHAKLEERREALRRQREREQEAQGYDPFEDPNLDW